MIARIIFLILLSALVPCAASARPTKSVPLIGAESPEWRWRQVLASPRIGGRLTAVAVDPRNPRRIFVGTEEGNLIRSVDGGVTWDERTQTPFVVQARSVGLQRVPPPDPESADSARMSAYADAPHRFYVDDLPAPFFDGMFDIINLPIGTLPYPNLSVLAETLLFDSVESRRQETIPVKKIAICPGAEYPLLIATARELFGSTDDGVTSSRLFFTHGDNTIEHVACSPFSPEVIALATTQALYRSKNGGLVFDPVPGGLSSRAVAFAKEPTHQVEILYSGSDGELYGGDPESVFGLQYLYPAENDPNTPSAVEINWIEATLGGEVWLATENGVVVSRDHGRMFHQVEPRLFQNRPALQVLVDSGERIAILLRDTIYASDDEGVTWHPFFFGITRRSFRQMAVAPAPDGSSQWWVVTSGELWTNVPPVRENSTPAAATRAWAKSSVDATPELSVTIDRVLTTTHLSNAEIESLVAKERARNLVPMIDLRVSVFDRSRDRIEERAGGMVMTISEGTGDREFEVLVQATWPLYDTLIFSSEVTPIANSLYELRRQIAFAAEDAWHERMLHLSRVAGGEVGGAQAEILRARVEALETVLDNWGWRSPPPEGNE